MEVYDAARLAILNRQPYPAAWPPLHPAFLAAVTYIFGEGYKVLYAAQALLSTATCLLIYLITKETFGRTAALIALAFSAVYVDAIWYSSVLMAETLGLLFLTLSVYLALKKAPPALSGAMLGLACLTKGVYLIALPAVCAWHVLRFGLKAGAPILLSLPDTSFSMLLGEWYTAVPSSEPVAVLHPEGLTLAIRDGDFAARFSVAPGDSFRIAIETAPPKR